MCKRKTFFYFCHPMKEINIEVTEDGSHTLYLPEMDEHYHSTHGAVQESEHVYIQTGLRECAKKQLNILEIGFGTGLNALLTYRYAKTNNLEIFYYTTELFPLEERFVKQFNYVENEDEKEFFQRLHQCEWEKEVQLTPEFTIFKNHTDITSEDSLQSSKKINLVYFDAFGPDKQPEMWDERIFHHIYNMCNDAAILATYCAKGEVRRRMQRAGFLVERLPGPPGKREILRGRK